MKSNTPSRRKFLAMLAAVIPASWVASRRVDEPAESKGEALARMALSVPLVSGSHWVRVLTAEERSALYNDGNGIDYLTPPVA